MYGDPSKQRFDCRYQRPDGSTFTIRAAASPAQARQMAREDHHNARLIAERTYFLPYSRPQS